MTAVDTAKNAADAVVQAAQNGTSIRASMSGLDWGAIAGSSLLAHVTNIATESRYYMLLGVNQDGDAAIVDERAEKPEVAVTEKQDLPLVKHAGFAAASQEDLTFAETAEWLISGVVLRQIAKSVDNAIVEQLETRNTPVDVSGAQSPSNAVLAAQASLLSSGLAPDVLAVAPDAYAALVGESAASGFATIGGVTAPSGTNQGTLFGMKLVATNAIDDGNGFLLDSRNVVVAHHSKAPQIWLSGMRTNNVLDLIGDYNAAAGVASPDGVAFVDFNTVGSTP